MIFGMKNFWHEYFDVATTYIDVDDGWRNAASGELIAIQNAEHRAKLNSCGQHGCLTHKRVRIFIK